MATLNFKRALFPATLLLTLCCGPGAAVVPAQAAPQSEDTDRTVEPKLRRKQAATGRHSPKTQPARPRPTRPPAPAIMVVKAKPKPRYRTPKNSSFGARPRVAR